jgi:hypothetical protein
MSSTLTTAVMTANISGTLAVIGVVLLVALLFQKEVASAAGSRFQKMTRILNISIIPLLIAFVLIVVSKVLEVIH